MNGFKAYRYYLALKLHFTTDKFNVFENKGNVRGSYETFEARNDKYLFDKLGRVFGTDRELIQFIASQFVYNNPNFIYDLNQAHDNYTQWVKVKESMTKIFSDDLNTILLEVEKNGYTLEDVFNCTLNDFPVIIKLYLGKRITAQTINIISSMNEVVAGWLNNKNLALVLESEIRIIYKMDGFLKYNKEKLQQLYTEFIENVSMGMINNYE